MKRSNTFSYSLAVIVLLLMAAGADAQVAHSKLVWLEGEPCIEAQVAVDAPQDVKEITVATSLFDKDGKNTWNGGGKIQLAPDKPAVVQIKLQGIANKDEQHRVTVRINQPALELDYSASFTFAAETGAIQWHGVIVQGSYPNERDVLAIQMNPVKDKNVQGLDLNLSIRDTDENVVSEKVEKLVVGEAAAYFEFDVTPGRESVGPYSLEYRIESDALAINFSATEKFAHANVLLPVTSFELDDTTWMTSDPTWAYGNVALGNSDRVTYDAQQVHSGKQSLRIDFNQGRQVGISSKQVLPGLAMKARIWVKGSGSQDVLHVRWRDHCDMTRAPWNWFPNESQETVCRLDFDDWRCFTVPVLGAGLQVKSPNGSTNAIDAPIYISSFTITPGRPNKDEQPGAPRTIWIDDIFAETQLSPDQQAAMEVRADTIDHLLHPQAKAFVAIGNGKNAPITGGKIRLVAKGRGDQTPVLEMMESLDVPAEGFAVKEFSLADLAAKSPMGPVDVDVSFVAPAAGIRRAERIVFKNPKSMGLFWDFEKPAAYNHFAYNRRPGWKPSSTVPGGAEGSAMALRLEVECPPPGPQHSIYNLPPEDALLLHPAMPGEVDRIEVMIKGGPAPVELRAVLIDSGLTGVTPKMYNMFWSDPVKVDWQDWRKVEFPAPAVPAWYGDRFKYFDDKPFYPLNLAFIARMIDEKPSEVFFDNIRVKTHLLPEDELLAWVDFPDDTHIRKPGSPLQIVLTNFASAEKKLSLSFELRSFQDIVQQQGKVDVAIPPGRKVVQNLVQSLPPGIFTLTVDGIGSGPFREYIQVLDATQYFGQDPPAFLKDVELAPGKWIFPPELRKTLGMTVEKVYLDWDNTEPEPGLFLPNWFNVVANEASANGSYQIQPVVGFGADWAGPHAQESIAAGEYSRFIGNYLQVPVSLNDWSNFTREIAREFKGRFPKIEFWENPDLEGGPQSLPPEKYADMLKILHKWLALYDPNAKTVAGGFNFDRALPYLESVSEPDKLEFDEIAVQMNIGELAPERADVEGFLDDLNTVLKVNETGKRVQLTELDWPIGEYLTPAQQAAYHCRVMLILNSRGAQPHRFSFINSGNEFPGVGIFYRERYGTSECVGAVLKPINIPKPSYFALANTKKFLESWKFIKSVAIPDFNLQSNRAFIYQNAAGQLCAAVWRTTDDARVYKLPAGWQQTTAKDAFGFDVSLKDGLRCIELPTLVFLPGGYSAEQLAFDLRTLAPADGKDAVLLALHVGEPESAKRAAYTATGTLKPQPGSGKLPGGRRVSNIFAHGIESEQFEFSLDRPGAVLLTRLWWFDGDGQKLAVKLNGDGEQPWDLSKGQAAYSGPCESTFVLKNCIAGKNTVSIRYEAPGNCASYRLEPIPDSTIDLTRWGILGAMQTKGELQKFKSAAASPLAIGKTAYTSGLGAHAVSLIEYPLDGQFSAFEVTVGIDAVTDGRGSVSFEINVDGATKADSGLMNGFSKPVTLKVDKLETARRMLLIVRDAGDKNQDDLADWVEGKLMMK